MKLNEARDNILMNIHEYFQNQVTDIMHNAPNDHPLILGLREPCYNYLLVVLNLISKMPEFPYDTEEERERFITNILNCARLLDYRIDIYIFDDEYRIVAKADVVIARISVDLRLKLTTKNYEDDEQKAVFRKASKDIKVLQSLLSSVLSEELKGIMNENYLNEMRAHRESIRGIIDDID